MWFVHHCLSVTRTCQPTSWADVGEIFAAMVLGCALVVAGFLGLMSLG